VEPQVYAESILTTCRFSLDAPVVCMAGVTGADLKKRVEHIMKNEPAAQLNGWKKCLLAAAGVISVALPVTVGIASAPRVLAQAPAAQAPSRKFDVASIKPNKSGDGRIMIGRPSPDRLTVTNMPLRELVRVAYQVQPFQISGGPDWIGSERFDVAAKADGPFSATEGWDMLRSLLEERFKLAVHTETKEMPIYALVLARSDGRLGEKLRPSGPNCAPQRQPAGLPGPPPPPPGAATIARGRGNDPNGPPRCPTIFGPGFMSARSTTMQQLARGLGPQVRRVVVDRTGLSGEFDADLEFTPEFRPPALPDGPNIAIPADGPSIFTAVQEQLGLKLESDKGPVEMVVIDRAESLIPD
jgi:uncharacterized protein (TIGR03435 family)